MYSIWQYLILNRKDYFATAEEYIQLKQLFKIDTFYEKLNLFMKLIGNLIMSILWKSHALSISFTLFRMAQDWMKYLHYLTLKNDIKKWREVIHSAGGPFISTNDETYQPYVYADGMQRLDNHLFGFTKKRTKRLE